ncbi:hypothetical protein G6F59_014746 [Rhizopus arrhizus]|nr:hypothetical protein G6F59_014746 [Rhizopus arrhizus]
MSGGGRLHEHLMRGRCQRQRELGVPGGVQHQPQVLDEDVPGGQRRVVARQHMRHAVLEHPAVARAVRDDLVQGVRVHAFAQAQRHRLGGGRDVHASQQLVDDLDLAARTGAVAQALDLAGHRFQHRAAGRVGGGATGGHHRHLAGSGLGRAPGGGGGQGQPARRGRPRGRRGGGGVCRP